MAKRPRKPKTSRRGHKKTTQAEPYYEVGFCKPPKHSRFPKGRSGNAKGRPPARDLNLHAVFQEALNEKTDIWDGVRTRRLSKFEALLLTTLDKAQQGDAKAQTIVIALLRLLGKTAETPEPASSEPVAANDAEIIADFLRRQGASTENAAAPEDEDDDPQNTPPNNGKKP